MKNILSIVYNIHATTENNFFHSETIIQKQFTKYMFVNITHLELVSVTKST